MGLLRAPARDCGNRSLDAGAGQSAGTTRCDESGVVSRRERIDRPFGGIGGASQRVRSPHVIQGMTEGAPSRPSRSW